MGGGGGSSSGDTSKTIHFASYIEDKHSNLLNTVAALRADLLLESPYTTYEKQDVSDIMFGIGFTVADFPVLYEMYGKFMAGYDLEVLWSITMTEHLVNADISLAVQADIVMNDEEITMNSSPAFKLAMRNRNAVSSSSFVIGKALIECNRTKALAVMSAEDKFSQLPDLNARYNAVLNWQKEVTDSYSELMRLYYLTAVQGIEADSTFAARDVLWPFEVLDFERAVLGTMRQNAGYQRTGLTRKRSTTSKILLISSYTVNGAFIGAECGGYVGAIIGAIVGFVVGLAVVLFE